MLVKNYIAILFLLVSIWSCRKSDPILPADDFETMYFPSNTDDSWEKIPVSTLNWKESAIPSLKEFLIEKRTKSFMILVNGRIAVEEYFNGHTPTTTWPWNSAGKTLVTAATTIAQQENFLSINDKVSKYIGAGWTATSLQKENLITIRHLLTMTSGLNDENQLVTKQNLTYLADAGTRWSYANVFQKLMDVVADASNKSFDEYFNATLKNKIGMEGYWNYGIIFKLYHSNTRSMARYGLLALNKGQWKKEQIINEAVFNESVSSSQSINPSYGYLWWLNGKSQYMVPGRQTVFQGSLIPNAPADMYAAMGAEDQRIYIIPSKKMVVVRMGESSDTGNASFAVSGFDNALWEKINAVIIN